jgi:tetratricopeptide (TPR) repeat protein
MTREQAIYVLSMLGVGAYLAFHGMRAARARKRRKELIESGVATPRKLRVSESWRWARGLLLIAPLVAGIFYFEPRLKAHFRPPWDQLILYGSLFVVVWVMVFTWRISRRDRVVDSAMRLLKARAVDGAIALLESSLPQSPTASRYNALGSIFSNEKRWEEAYDAYEKARAQAPERPIHLINCAITLAKLKRFAEAIILTQAGRKEYPFDAGVQLAEAIVLAEADRQDEAAERLRQATEFERVAGNDQRVDWVTRGDLRRIATKLIHASPTRGFEVKPIAAVHDESENGDVDRST